MLMLAGLSFSFIPAENQVVEYPKTSYCEGWDAGYKAGWCYDQDYGCIDPIVPLCPLAKYGKDSYQDGYNRGFVAGKAAKVLKKERGY